MLLNPARTNPDLLTPSSQPPGDAYDNQERERRKHEDQEQPNTTIKSKGSAIDGEFKWDWNWISISRNSICSAFSIPLEI